MALVDLLARIVTLRADVSVKVYSDRSGEVTGSARIEWFSQAGNHALLSYIPICSNCGLILCELNMRYFACPYCSSQILTPSVRISLVVCLEAQISERLAKEREK